MKTKGQLGRQLQIERDRLHNLAMAMEQLPNDLRHLSREGGRVVYCVDFRDLALYLSWKPPGHAHSGAFSRDDVQSYISALLFLRSQQEIVLLPPYYREFRESIQSLVRDPDAASLGRELWLRKLRRRLERERTDEGGLLPLLERSLNGGVSDVETLLSQARKRLTAVLVDLGRSMNHAHVAIRIMERFDRLFETQKLVGLRTVLGKTEEIDLEEDALFFWAHARFKQRKGNAVPANQKDAEAISIVHQLNNRHAPKNCVFVLVSAAPTMGRVVRSLNEGELAEQRSQLQFRGPSFWSLWFSALFRAGKGAGRPPLKEVERLTESLREPIQLLEDKCDDLGDSLKRVRQVSGSDLPNLEADMQAMLSDLADLLARIERPIMDGRRLDVEISDAFLPIESEEEAKSVLTRLSRLLENLTQEGESLDHLQREIDVTLARLESILITLESSLLSGVVMLESSREVAFLSGLSLQGEKLDERALALIAQLEEDGTRCASSVFQEIAKLRDQGEIDFEASIVMSRAFILEKRLGAASRELQNVPTNEQTRPSYLLAEAMLSIAQHDYEEAEKTLRSLVARYPKDPIVNFRLAETLFARYREEKDPALRDEAINILETARSNAKDISLLLRSEIACTYWQIIFGIQAYCNNIGLLESAEREVRGILSQWEERSPMPILDDLQKLLGKIEMLEDWHAS